MGAREFVNQTLHIIRLYLPALHQQRIKGKHAETIADAIPQKTWVGKRLGYVNKDLRLLLGLATLLRQIGRNSIGPFETNPNITNAIAAVSGTALCNLGDLCALAFWEYVRIRYSYHKHKCICINPDWSVVDTPITNEASTTHGSLLNLITTQGWMAAVTEDVKNDIERHWPQPE